MKHLLDKETFSIKDIEALIELNAEESLNLEFKRKEALELKKKHEIAKDISSFANSNGGIIIYGLEEKDHFANSLSFINGNKITKEWIEQIINTNIYKKIKNIEIFPIRNNGKIEESVYLIKVPESTDGPHMVNNKYYRRYNFQSVPMEEYEIRSYYFKTQKPKLKIGVPIIHNPEIGYVQYFNEDTKLFRLIFTVENTGNILERDFKLEIFIPKEVQPTSSRFKDNLKSHQVMRYSNILSNHFSISNKETIFPKETLEMGDTIIHIPLQNNRDLLDKRINFNLYYSSGIQSLRFSIKEIFNLHNQSIASQNKGYIDTDK